jgi:hypothetical protein
LNPLFQFYFHQLFHVLFFFFIQLHQFLFNDFFNHFIHRISIASKHFLKEITFYGGLVGVVKTVCGAVAALAVEIEEVGCIGEVILFLLPFFSNLPYTLLFIILL